MDARVKRSLGGLRARLMGDAPAPPVTATSTVAPNTGSQPRPTPPECPPGWVVGPPDFVIVGAEKSGTSRWLRLLRQHPDIHSLEGFREIHFWDDIAGRWPTEDDFDRYHRFFPRPPGGLAGEKTPHYMSLWWVPRMLAEAAPKAKIIVLLRDPVERYVSGRTQLEKYRDENVSRGMSDVVYTRRSVESSMHRGQYALQLPWIMDAFPPEQVLILQYERCNLAPANELARTFAFIGVEPFTPDAAALQREVNPAWMEKLPLEPERRELMRRLYEPEVLRLTAMVPDLDLSLWPNFAHLERPDPPRS